MDQKNSLQKEITGLEKKISSVTLPPELRERCLEMIERLSRMVEFGNYSSEYERISYYIDWIVSLPWDKRSQDILDLKRAKQVLDKNHYGLEDIKERILEYISVLKLKSESGKENEIARAPILCFVGLVGTGKTTISRSIAESLNRKFVRIPLGGMSSFADLRGISKSSLSAEPGLVVKALQKVGVKNPVILLDELDRVAESGRASIMGVLLELLDPEQNMAFRDHFIDYPIDLSEVLFVATANNTTNISVAVMDRLEPMEMPSYTDEEKITIAKDYLLPKAIEDSGLDKNALSISADVWPKIVRPLGYDAGIRTLERTIKKICRRVAKLTVEKGKRTFNISTDNLKEFIPIW